MSAHGQKHRYAPGTSGLLPIPDILGVALSDASGRRHRVPSPRIRSRGYHCDYPDGGSPFGIYPVESEGSLRTNIDLSKIGVEVVISTLEAVLIEGLEPRQNRRRGDDFQAIEFLQSEDPEL